MDKIAWIITIVCNLGIAVGFIYSSYNDAEMMRCLIWSILLICDIYTIYSLVQAFTKYERLENINRELLKKIK